MILTTSHNLIYVTKHQHHHPHKETPNCRIYVYYILYFYPTIRQSTVSQINIQTHSSYTLLPSQIANIVMHLVYKQAFIKKVFCVTEQRKHIDINAELGIYYTQRAMG